MLFEQLENPVFDVTAFASDDGLWLEKERNGQRLANV
jgi:hypothetical protein